MINEQIQMARQKLLTGEITDAELKLALQQLRADREQNYSAASAAGKRGATAKATGTTKAKAAPIDANQLLDDMFK